MSFCFFFLTMSPLYGLLIHQRGMVVFVTRWVLQKAAKRHSSHSVFTSVKFAFFISELPGPHSQACLPVFCKVAGRWLCTNGSGIFGDRRAPGACCIEGPENMKTNFHCVRWQWVSRGLDVPHPLATLMFSELLTQNDNHFYSSKESQTNGSRPLCVSLQFRSL